MITTLWIFTNQCSLSQKQSRVHKSLYYIETFGLHSSWTDDKQCDNICYFDIFQFLSKSLVSFSSQGRLFLSPRIIGFYANLFGHKTKFFFLWEDIDDIQVIPPSLATMGGPSLLIILRRGRGMDAKHGAKALDPDGRLRFQFQSFVSFSVANR